MGAEAELATRPETVWLRRLVDEAATEALAADIAELVGAGDLITLSGDLGAGKTTFARALIRRLTGEPNLEVPSPTFLLMQIYDGGPAPIVHADFYRIERPDDLVELGWDEATDGALVLVEWPDRGGRHLGLDRLDIKFTLDPASGAGGGPAGSRTATVTGFGAFAARLARAKAIQDILEPTSWRDAQRHFMQGDASTRSFERLVKDDGSSAVLMIAPQRPDGPPIRYGKPYSAIARLAEDIRPFIAVDKGLRSHGFSAPEIYAFDLSTGVILMEDLGSEPIINDAGVDVERYVSAASALARLHATALPDVLPIGDDETYRIPTYDLDALSIEVELLLDWYAPHCARAQLSSGAKATFVNLWRRTLTEGLTTDSTWTLRDYHSPNLIWLPRRQGVAQVGMVDFQDCVLGHPAYDVVSLLQDARVDVPDAAELKLLSHYARLRREADAGFDMGDFARAYAILGAQRATKILGIFTRLNVRDHKPHYLAHIPRVEKYLAKDMNHPVLAELKIWYETNLPRIFEIAA
ncbi:tRNA (Adenosine(37)-N6)-threonylcarbamoyltransferase complex ATPase subunit type 1 TsaE [Methylocella tundrae]|uniref:tRNA threonylcarbamoyladenosine biosynthesis protein TsaE n=1 Tax=Methylocella tundrae TaxID=227605 RepID=A0A8B6MAC7_METTU|nr:tRNA (adenosine(37)-N6)-threonylcarbamoyltransferase complex ATPase subunit type 1 TsaE [Methylocella tundrae]VTZ51475.1 tRNA (Adenosine(37)-N6)-threonylcarbamoyltransferase complex ATPase subunit type 1 TsaE [Methylocella tundrae]